MIRDHGCFSARINRGARIHRARERNSQFHATISLKL